MGRAVFYSCQREPTWGLAPANNGRGRKGVVDEIRITLVTACASLSLMVPLSPECSPGRPAGRGLVLSASC